MIGMLKTKVFLYGTLVLFMVGSMVGVNQAYASSEAPAEKTHHGGIIRECLSKLELTNDQRLKIREAVKSHHSKLKELREKIQAERMKLEEARRNKDRQSIREVAGEMREIRTKLNSEREAIIDEIKQHLNGEQQSRFEACIQEAKKQRKNDQIEKHENTDKP